MRQQIEGGVLIFIGLCVGFTGALSCMGGGWIFVAGLLEGLTKQNAPRILHFRLGLSIGLVMGVVAILVMGAMGMVTH
jgi:hypothetical protein